ncbi:MAG: hypothetical protein KKB51_11325 [Candidatus Riflebacteria bacterium]|nr:hypothetical protein [Candidatus Riflebacteria bacterium]
MQRSRPLKVAIFLLSIQALLLLPTLFDGMISANLGMLSRIACVMIGLFMAVAVAGVWQNKKTGVYSYVAFTLFSQLFFLISKQGLGIKTLLFSILILGLTSSSLTDME